MTSNSRPRNSNFKNSIKDVLILLIVFSLGIVVANNNDTSAASLLNQFTNKKVDTSGTPADLIDLNLLWDAWSLLDGKYVGDSNEISPDEKLYGLIEGLAESYNDPYTEFFSPDELQRFNESVEGGSFSGVGMEVGLTNEGLLRVVAPLKGTPAETAGIQPGDIILQIDDIQTIDIPLDEALSLIRGEEGTKVSFVIARMGQEATLSIEVERAEIDIPILRSQIKDGVFIISIYSFSADLENLFRKSIAEYEKSDTDGLIIDLRNNPGGYLLSAIEVGSWFADAGEILVREQSGGDESESRLYRSKGYFVDKIDKQPVVVLVNQGSASASEIFAGIIQDYDLGTIVGETTYGKGSVQELIPLRDGTAIKITTAKWLTPEGRSISEGGLVPDVEIADDVMTIEIDEQLEKAIKIIND